MKELINFSPAFNPTNKTVDFKFYPGGFQLDKLYSIVNITQGTPIYIPGVAGYGYTAFDGTMLTLSYDTTAHRSTDILNIYYDTEPYTANRALERGGHLEELTDLMKTVVIELKTIQFVLANGLNIQEGDIENYRNAVSEDGE